MQISREDLLQAYRSMRTIRDFEERLHVEFASGEIPGFVHLYAGEEASAVGVCMHLTDSDTIASTLMLMSAMAEGDRVTLAVLVFVTLRLSKEWAAT
jgi:hypothetical protein